LIVKQAVLLAQTTLVSVPGTQD